MSDFNIYDFQTLAERGISISFNSLGMTASKSEGDSVICEDRHHIEYELLINLDMTLLDLMDVWFPQKNCKQDLCAEE